MKKAKTRAQRRRVAMLRKVLLTLTLVMVVAMVTVGGTIAWLTDKTETIENTFTVGDIVIELDETVDNTENKASFKLIPGNSYLKDPIVTVKANSEKCYLFVKFEEINSPENFLTYTSTLQTTDWTRGDGTDIPDTVWYRIVETDDEDQSWKLLTGTEDEVINITNGEKVIGTNGYVTVNANVEKKDLYKADGTTFVDAPQLKYTAYAVQFENFTPKAAWAEVNK